MEKKRKPAATFVICIQNDGHPVSLERGKVYRTMPDRKAASLGMMRIRDESGEEYLYPKSFFAAIKLPQAARKALSMAS